MDDQTQQPKERGLNPMGEQLLPRYYLRHETPTGLRLAYPVPDLEGYPRSYYPKELPVVEWSTPEEIPIVRSGSWLIAPEPLTLVTATWLPHPTVGPYVKTETPPTDPMEHAAWAAAPNEPDPKKVTAVESCGCDDDCSRCTVFRMVYVRSWQQPPPVEQVIDFASYQPLPGDIDPDPGRDWVVDDNSLLAVYGEHTAHLWPGQLPGFRERIYELLKGDPRVRHVFDSERHRDQPRGSLQTTVEIPWEKPRTALRSRYGRSGRKLQGKEQVPQPIAHTATTAIRVPSGLRAPHKAAAIYKWDLATADYLAALIPVDVVTCDRCDGHGHLLRVAAEGMSS